MPVVWMPIPVGVGLVIRVMLVGIRVGVVRLILVMVVRVMLGIRVGPIRGQRLPLAEWYLLH